MVTVWKIAPGENASAWLDCLERGVISINWLDDQDYTHFSTKGEVTAALRKNSESGEGTRGGKSIWCFTYKVEQDHVVVANDGLSRVVGIGRVISGYLPPDHPRNPNRRQEEHRHVRRVDWLIGEPVDLPKEVFGRHTVQLLEPQQYNVVLRAYKQRLPHLLPKLDELFGPESTVNNLGPAADEGDAFDDSDYVAPRGDQRETAWQQITKRRGQPQFRNQLRRRYGDSCMVTGCKVLDVLEAAHIDPYRHERHNNPRNGVLLRADIHTLFDLDLLGIEPTTLRVELHPDIAAIYGTQVRRTLSCSGGNRPSQDALKRRYAKFQKRAKRSTD